MRPIASLKLLDVNQHYTFEKWFFWSNPYKIEVMNFSYRNTRVSKLSSHDRTYNMIWVTWWNFVSTSWSKIMVSKLLFQNSFILRRPRVGILADIIKIVTLKKSQKKFERITNYVSKWNLYLYFLIDQNLPISDENMLISAELKGYVIWFKYFLHLP